MSEIIAEETDAWAVINTGWVRPWKGHQEGSNKPTTGPTQADVKKGIANLNNIKHCKKNPLKGEFLTPLEDFKNIIINDHKKCYIFLIHGMDDTIRDYKGVDVVLGYGAGDPPRNSCPLTFRDRFAACLHFVEFQSGWW